MTYPYRTTMALNTYQYRETTMIDPKKIEQIARQVHESMPKGIREFGEDVEKKIRQTLQAVSYTHLTLPTTPYASPVTDS